MPDSRMTLTRPHLVLLRGASPPDPDQLSNLEAAFQVVEVENLPAALRLLREETADSYLLCRGGEALSGNLLTSAADAATILHSIGEGVAVVDDEGHITWHNQRFDRYDQQVRQSFAERCRDAIEAFRHSVESGEAGPQNRCERFSFSAGKAHYEMMVCPTDFGAEEPATVRTVVGVIWEVTSSRELQAKIDAIDAAGSELMRIEAASIAQLNLAGRLKLLEEKIVHYVRDLLRFDNFEIRLLDRESNQLELVVAEGISPLKVGEVLYAELENNGISGYVAATGKSYICPDVSKDPLYYEGLADPGSSLTVPLRLHDRVIGVFNIEAHAPNVFSENDRQFAEIFGWYIAMAMNILDLLVVEHYTTNEQVAAAVLDELSTPLGEIMSRADTLRQTVPPDGEARGTLDEIMKAAEEIRSRIEACAAGPRTILGAERELSRLEPDPRMIGKRVLVADDEPAIGETILAILSQKGCQVVLCRTGVETIETIRSSPAGHGHFDLVISDIKMPDRNGYEVFRTVKEVHEGTAVILMTGFGYDPHHSIVRASQEGLNSFLFKPFRASQLVDAVARVFS
ncbi:MAG: response regulator [Phycisphaerales bacterium]|nr:MAG: response regulator [Phycisphaerales bacterium]